MLIDLFNCFLSSRKLLASAVFHGNKCYTWTVCRLKNGFFFALNLPVANFLWWLLFLYHEKQCHSLFVFSKLLMIPYASVVVHFSYVFQGWRILLYVISPHIVVLPCNSPLDFSDCIISFPEMGQGDGNTQTIRYEVTSPVHNVILMFSVLHSFLPLPFFPTLISLGFFHSLVLTWYFKLPTLV